jgi:hypothetical protein
MQDFGADPNSVLVATGPSETGNDKRKGTFILPIPAVALMGTVLTGLLTAIFARWAANAWSFPQFLLALPLLVYFPGKCLLDRTNLKLSRLEHLTVSLVLGMMVSSLVYWLAGFLAVPYLFFCWPVVALVLCFSRGGKSWPGVADCRVVVAGQHGLLFAVIGLAWVALAVAPLYYRNMTPTPEGGMTVCPIGDVAFHLSTAEELTHTIPPQSPFLSGKQLSYHYGMDLFTAMLSKWARLSVLDLTLRFVPTFLVTVALLAVFCFARAWVGSSGAAVLTAFLVMFGEDFSFVPGLWCNSTACWSAQYFGAPTTFSLYFLNPMLPALCILFSGLLCMLQYFRHGGNHSLVLTAFHFAFVLEYKVFTGVHLLLALLIAGILHLVLARDTRLLKIMAVTALPLLLLASPLLLANAAGGQQSMLFYPGLSLVVSLRELGLAGTDWGGQVIALLNRHPPTFAAVASLGILVLPGYFLGSLGLRVLAIPLLAKELLTPRPSTGPRFFLAVFVLAGPLVALTCAVVPRELPPEATYNNAVWFFIQSKYVAWIFVIEFLRPLFRLRGPVLRAGALTVILGLSIPSTVQFFHFLMALEPQVMDKNDVQLLRFLRRAGSPGAVVVTRPSPAFPLFALTKCRTPLTDRFAEEFASAHGGQASADELTRRSQDLDDFWNGWDRSELRNDILARYQVDYLVVGHMPGQDPALGACITESSRTTPPQFTIQPCFANARYFVYKVHRELQDADVCGRQRCQWVKGATR